MSRIADAVDAHIRRQGADAESRPMLHASNKEDLVLSLESELKASEVLSRSPVKKHASLASGAE
jgi:hypothetical protein